MEGNSQSQPLASTYACTNKHILTYVCTTYMLHTYIPYTYTERKVNLLLVLQCVHVKVQRQLCKVGSLLPPLRGFWAWNLVKQALTENAFTQPPNKPLKQVFLYKVVQIVIARLSLGEKNERAWANHWGLLADAQMLSADVTAIF